MGRRHRPLRGSLAFSPRKRASSEVPKFASWPEIKEGPKLQAFAGYKAGMTHAFVVDYRKRSTTAGQEVQVPCTIIEVPPMRIAAVRFYQNTSYGLKTAGEVWADKFTKELSRRLPVPKEYKPEEEFKNYDGEKMDDIRVLAYTQPILVTGIPKKVPDLMEIRVGGATMKDRLEYAKSILGKEVKISEFTTDGKMVDIAAVTKGKGFQGHIKRWGVKLQPHKNSKHRRMIGTLGPHNPSYILPSVPQSGQMGYHQRTEYNKRVLKIGDNGEEITPKGGFLNYGVVRNGYVLVHGSIPGPTKRIIGLRDPARFPGVAVEKPTLTYISTASKQGA